MQSTHINENFAKLAESLYIADRKAREAVEMRAQVEKKMANKEKVCMNAFIGSLKFRNLYKPLLICWSILSDTQEIWAIFYFWIDVKAIYFINNNISIKEGKEKELRALAKMARDNRAGIRSPEKTDDAAREGCL